MPSAPRVFDRGLPKEERQAAKRQQEAVGSGLRRIVTGKAQQWNGDRNDRIQRRSAAPDKPVDAQAEDPEADHGRSPHAKLGEAKETGAGAGDQIKQRWSLIDARLQRTPELSQRG